MNELNQMVMCRQLQHTLSHLHLHTIRTMRVPFGSYIHGRSAVRTVTGVPVHVQSITYVAGYASHACSLDNVIRVRACVLPKQHTDPCNRPQTFGGIESVCLAEIAEDATPQFIRQLWTHTRHWQCVLDEAGP